MGASHGAYWLSWFAVSVLYALVASLSTFLAGFSFGFGFFRETPFYIVVFFLFFPFVLAMQTLGYFLSTLTPTLKSSNTVSYAVMLFAIVVESFSSDNMLISFIFTEDAGSVVTFLKYFFCFYPPFSYTKIFTNITQYSGFHFSFTQRRWVESSLSYGLSTFAQNIEDKLPFGGGLYYRYSDLWSMVILYGNVFFFAILAWYFDHVLPSNRGRAEPLYFPFKRLLNAFRNPNSSPRVIQKESLGEFTSFSLTDEEESAVRERNRVNSNSQQRKLVPGLRIRNLSKTFSSLFGRGKKVEALRRFSLEIEGNELMAILGHNGAGKTTLINILTGVLPPD